MPVTDVGRRRRHRRYSIALPPVCGMLNLEPSRKQQQGTVCGRLTQGTVGGFQKTTSCSPLPLQKVNLNTNWACRTRRAENAMPLCVSTWPGVYSHLPTMVTRN